MTYYAIANGRERGIVRTWDEAKELVTGYPGAIYKKFRLRDDAEKYLEKNKCSSKNSPKKISVKKETVIDTDNFHMDEKVSLDLEKMNIVPLNGTIKIYTDGSCITSSGECAGYGVVIIYPDASTRLIYGKSDGNTNNNGELRAIYESLNAVRREKHHVKICTDSKYCINIFEDWITFWQDNDWKTKGGSKVKNVELIQSIQKLLTRIRRKERKVTFKHIRAHNGDPGNELADTLANHGRMGKIYADD